MGLFHPEGFIQPVILSTKIFQITRTETDFSGASREIMKEQFRSLEAGQYKVTIEKVEHGKYTPTRYKYYFASVMAAILEKCQDKFSITDHFTGEEHPPRSTTDIHEIMKLLYNTITVMTPKGAFTSGGTTRALSDREFIGEYMEFIMADFSLPPYNVEFMEYEEWKEAMKKKRGQN